MSQPQTPIPTNELVITDVLDRIDQDHKMLLQNSIDELTQREYEEQVGGGRIAREGAWVISAEGEGWREGLNATEGRGKLGRFYKSEEFNELVKVTFTKPNGLYVGDSTVLLPMNKRIQHPLSKAGFYVPKEGGYITLDDGWLLIVSRTGIFTGKGGWGKARELHDKYTYEVANNQNLMDRIHALTTQLNHTEAQLMIMSASREDYQLWGQEQQEKFRHAWDVLAKLRDQISSLNSQMEGLQWTNIHQENTIKENLKNMDILARELRTFVQDDHMLETMKQASSRLPELSVNQTNGLKDRLRKTGIIREDPNEKLLADQKKLIDNLLMENDALKNKQETKPKDTRHKAPSQQDTDEDDGEDDDDDIVGDDKDDDSETKETEQPKNPTPPKTDNKDGKKKTVKEILTENLGKLAQDAKEKLGKSVAKTPKEETKQDEPKDEEPPQDDVEPNEEEDG